MNVTGISQIETQPALDVSSEIEVKDPRLREACEKFEGMLLGIMMKEAMRRAPDESGGGAAGGMDSFREFCVEQVANTMAETSSLGLADQLVADLGMGGAGYESR